MTRQIFKTCPYKELREIDVLVVDGHVYLSGQVPSFYLKQMATAWVKERLPDLKLFNHLEVAANTKKVKETS